MEFVTNEKLTIVGAAGMIGSNMAQTAIMMGLTPNICLYDPYAPGLEGVAEELYHCGFEGVNVTFTSDIKEALTGAKYIVNSAIPNGRVPQGFFHNAIQFAVVSDAMGPGTVGHEIGRASCRERV